MDTQFVGFPKIPRLSRDICITEKIDGTCGQIFWDDEKAKKVVKDVFMGAKMMALCETTLKKLSEEQKLTEQHMSLYEKFCEGEEVKDA